jgi:hypothetical protein
LLGVEPGTRGRQGALKRLLTLGFVVMLAAAFTAAASSPIANAAPPLPKVTVNVDASGGCGSVVVTGDWTPIAGQDEAAVSLWDETTVQNKTDTNYTITSTDHHVSFTVLTASLPPGIRNHRFLAEITILNSNAVIASGSLRLNGPNALACGMFPS